MPVSDTYVPWPLQGELAQADRSVHYTVEVPLFDNYNLTGVNVKTFKPCDRVRHRAIIEIASSKLPSLRLLDLPSDNNFYPFIEENISMKGKVNFEYEDCYDCVHPLDVGCASPVLAFALDKPVAGSYFKLNVILSDYQPDAPVDVLVALCYDRNSSRWETLNV